MLRNLCLTLAGVVVCAGLSFAAAKSGLGVGESVPAFYVQDVTGQFAGEKPLCYRCRFGDRPVVTVFTQNPDEKIESLVKQIDKSVGEHKRDKMAAFVVVLSDEPKGQETKLKEIAKKAGGLKNVPLTTYENADGPAEYKLSKEAETTVMMWVDGEVKVNHAFAKGELDDEAIETIMSETSKILN